MKSYEFCRSETVRRATTVASIPPSDGGSKKYRAGVTGNTKAHDQYRRHEEILFSTRTTRAESISDQCTTSREGQKPEKDKKYAEAKRNVRQTN